MDSGRGASCAGGVPGRGDVVDDGGSREEDEGGEDDDELD